MNKILKIVATNPFLLIALFGLTICGGLLAIDVLIYPAEWSNYGSLIVRIFCVILIILSGVRIVKWVLKKLEDYSP